MGNGVRAPEIVLNQDRPKSAPTCAKCAHLETYPQVRCRVGGPLEPCPQFKDASIDRTFRRGLKGTYPHAEGSA